MHEFGEGDRVEVVAGPSPTWSETGHQRWSGVVVGAHGDVVTVRRDDTGDISSHPSQMLVHATAGH